MLHRAIFGLRTLNFGEEKLNQDAYQPLPIDGKLAENLNVHPEELVERLSPFRNSKVYYYVVDTVECEEGRLYQTGSGPNFQGGMVTLCSCKHKMRTYLTPDSWEGVWIAGYTGSTGLNGSRLFYLMRVNQAFESHREFWASDCIPEETKLAKASHADRFGDIYEPRGASDRPYLPMYYIRPCISHVHCEPGDWKKDIRYELKGRRPSLLVGDPDYSFIWDIPMIASPGEIGRGERRATIGELFPV